MKWFVAPFIFCYLAWFGMAYLVLNLLGIPTNLVSMIVCVYSIAAIASISLIISEIRWGHNHDTDLVHG